MYASFWQLFKKGGQEGWAALIPLYNVLVVCDIIQKPRWWMILLHIPFINFVVYVFVCLELAKAFGQERSYGFCIIFFPFLCIPFLAFGAARYKYLEEDGLMGHLIDY